MVCEHVEIVRKINEEFPNSNWNGDAACNAWQERQPSEQNDDYDEAQSEDYACNCKACGQAICGWCV